MNCALFILLLSLNSLSFLFFISHSQLNSWGAMCQTVWTVPQINYKKVDNGEIASKSNSNISIYSCKIHTDLGLFLLTFWLCQSTCILAYSQDKRCFVLHFCQMVILDSSWMARTSHSAWVKNLKWDSSVSRTCNMCTYQIPHNECIHVIFTLFKVSMVAFHGGHVKNVIVNEVVLILGLL